VVERRSDEVLVPLIDAHHHLWRYTTEEYDWIGESMKSLRRDFLFQDLIAATSGTDVTGTVVVQARQTLDETRWLLDLADRSEIMLGAVGWAPLAAPSFAKIMEEFAGRQKLLGLRHVVQAEAPGFMHGAAFNQGIERLGDLKLVYDILIHEGQLAEAIEFVDRHPGQVFVLDHIAKPRIREGVLNPWAQQIHELARRKNVWCKVSGLVTEADWTKWSAASLRPYLDRVVDAFGCQRLMAGSDWPVCLVASDYAAWFNVLKAYFASFSTQEQHAVFEGSARAAYGLTS